MDQARRSLREDARLVHAAFLCSELNDYRKGRREKLDHWLQIQLLGPKGNFRRIEMQREAFLAGFSKASPRLDTVELNQRLKAASGGSNIEVTDMKIEAIGRDGNAVYFYMQTNMIVGNTSLPVTAMNAVTLLNSLPLSINVYEASGSARSREQLPLVLRELLNSLLAGN